MPPAEGAAYPGRGCMGTGYVADRAKGPRPASAGEKVLQSSERYVRNPTAFDINASHEDHPRTSCRNVCSRLPSLVRPTGEEHRSQENQATRTTGRSQRCCGLDGGCTPTFTNACRRVRTRSP